MCVSVYVRAMCTHQVHTLVSIPHTNYNKIQTVKKYTLNFYKLRNSSIQAKNSLLLYGNEIQLPFTSSFVSALRFLSQ